MKKVSSKSLLGSSKTILSAIPCQLDLETSEKEVKKKMIQLREKLGAWQNTLYAHGRYGVLVCIQGMDTSGKDSLIREIFKDFNTRGIMSFSFKVPTEMERKHDYLWRHYLALPMKGKFSIFNRTHYENVIATRVHPEYLLKEYLHDIKEVQDVTESFWERRYRQIVNFERHLYENGTIIFKFFLHLSKEEQRKRLLRRLYKKEKHWKFSPDDLKERALWEEYMHNYEIAIRKTHRSRAPWHIIPADDKAVCRYLVVQILWDNLKEYRDIKEPDLDEDIKKHIHTYIKNLESEA